MAKFTVTLGNSARLGLKISADGIFGIAQQILSVLAFNFLKMPCEGERLPIEEIAAAGCAIEGNLVGSENQAGKTVSRVGHECHVAPGISGVARMNPNRVAVHTANRLSGDFIAGSAAHVPKNELICRKGNGFA